MGKYIIGFQIILNISGVGLFLSGWYFGNPTIMIAGGVIMVVDDIMTVFSGAMNIMGPAIAWAVAAFFLSPWWYSLFWSALVFNVMNVPGSIIKIFTFKRVVQQAEEALRPSD